MTCQGGGQYYVCDDAFVAKLDPSGSALVYSTYLGGSDQDWGMAMMVDGHGRAYVAGATWSTNFPATPDAYDPSFQGRSAAFMTRLSGDGSTLDYSTFLGGAVWTNFADAISVDSGDAVYLGGMTTSSDFPTTPGAYDTTYNGGADLFVTKLVLRMRPQFYLPGIHLNSP